MEKKTCTKCFVEKPLSEFYPHRRDPDKVATNPMCKACQKAYHAGWYRDNRQAVIARTKARKARNLDERAFLREMKNKPCMDCGGKFPACAMDFDHRPGEKKIKGISNMGKKAVLEEVKKCDLVCANCHRIRTFARKRKVSATQ